MRIEKVLAVALFLFVMGLSQMVKISESRAEIRHLLKVFNICRKGYQWYLDTIVKPETVHCPRCRCQMTVICRAGLPAQFRCMKCRRSRSIFFNTLFYRMKSPFHRILLVLLLIYLNIPQHQIIYLTNLSRDTVGYYQSISRCVYSQMWYHSEKYIGGEGITVEIDEAIVHKRKYHKGRSKKQIWIFGMVEKTVTDDGKLLIYIVPDRTSRTLIPLICKHIRTGSKIISDEWRAYNCLSKLNNYTHITVNHSIAFKNKETGDNTNSIEGVWAHLRRSFPETGVRERFLPDFIARFIIRKSGKDDFVNFAKRVTYYHPDSDSGSSSSDDLPEGNVMPAFSELSTEHDDLTEGRPAILADVEAATQTDDTDSYGAGTGESASEYCEDE